MNLYNTSSEQIDVPVLTQVRIIAIAVLLTLILLIILSRCFLAGIIDAVLGWQMNFKCVDTTASINTQADTRIDSDSLSEENVFKCPVMMNGQEVIDCEGNINTAAININDLVSQMGKTFDGDGKRTVIVDENGVLRAEKMNGETLETSEPEEEPGDGTGTGGTSFGSTTKGGLPIGSGGYSEYVYYDGKLQLLKTDGSTLIISQGNSVLLSGSYDENGNVSLGYLGGTTKINGDEIILNEAIFKGQGDKMLAVDDEGRIHLRDIPSGGGGGAQEVSIEGNELTIDGKTITLPDGSVTQTLTLNGNQLSISQGNTVTLPDGTGSQTLSLNGNDLSITGGNTITIPTNTDNQTLSLNGNTLTITNGNSITLPTGGADNWGGQIAVTNATLIGNGTSASPLGLAQQGATSGQVLTWNGSAWVPQDSPSAGGDDWGTQVVQTTGGLLTGDGTAGTPLAVNTAGVYGLFSGTGPVLYDGSGNYSCPTCVTSATTLFTLAATTGPNSTITSGSTVTLTAGNNMTTANNGSGTVTVGTINNPVFSTSVSTPAINAGTGYTLFQVDANGDITKINNVDYAWPGTQGGAGTVLTNDGAGNLTWETSPSGLTIPFTNITSGTNIGQTLTVGNGSTLTFSGTGIINANQFDAGGTTTAVDLDSAEVAGVLGIVNGGTNATTYTQNEFLWYDGTSIVASGYDQNSFMTAGTDLWVDQSGDTMTGDLYINGANLGVGYDPSTLVSAVAGFNGNVGIGTATPGEALEIVGNVEFSGALMPGGLAGTSGQVLISQGAGLAPVWTNSADVGLYIGDTMAHTAGGTLDMGANTLFGNSFSIPETGNTLFNSGQVGIRNASPGYALTVGNTGGTLADDGSIIAYGTYEVGPAAPSGAGIRMMWLPGKHAFRAGRLTITDPTLWDDANIGEGSVAFGQNTMASGFYSSAFGADTVAIGGSSFAVGDQSEANNHNSVAMGSNAVANGVTSFAFGTGIANAAGSFSLGGGTSNGSSSFTIGTNITAESYSEMVVGRYNEPYTPNSTTAWDADDQLFVIGNGTSLGSESNAMTVLKKGHVGLGTSIPTEVLDVVGNVQFTGALMPGGAAGTSGQVLTSQGPGAAPVWTNAADVGQYIGDVTAHTAGGTLDMGANTLFGNNFSIPNTGNTLFNSGQVGIRNSSPGYGLTLGNTGGTAADDGSIVAYGTLGTGDVAPSGAGTRMMWLPAKAAFRAGYVDGTQWDDVNIGDYSVAFGGFTIASGPFSTAMGRLSEATGDRSTAIGSQVDATGDISMALGRSSQATGQGSMTLGYSTRASGQRSSAFGADIESRGDYSFGIGLDQDLSQPVITDNNTMAIMNGEVGIGTVSPGYLLQVGNTGDGTQARANAWNTLSDRSLKTNITEMTGALEKIGKLNAYYYNWGVGTDTSRQFGVISQEVEAVLPEITSRGDDGYLGLDYGKLSPLLIAGINEQQQQIEEHEEKIDLIGPLLEEAGQEVQVVRKQVDEVQVRVDEQGQAIESQSSQLAEANVTLDQFGNMIEEQQTDVANVEGEVAGVSTTLTNVQGQVAQASTDIESVRNEITNLQQASEEINTVQTEVETLSSQVTTDVTSINTDLTEMQARIAELETQVLGAQGSATIDVSTDSGTLVTADQDASFNTLTVTGQTSLYDLGVAGTLTAGLIGVDGIEGSINSLSADQPLKLQALGLSGIEMVGGKVAIDQGGTVSVKEGVVEVNDKMVGVETIEPGQDTIQVSRSWSKAPRVVNATPEYDTNVWIEGISESGFTIRVKEAPPEKRHIHWFAVFGTN